MMRTKIVLMFAIGIAAQGRIHASEMDKAEVMAVGGIEVQSEAFTNGRITGQGAVAAGFVQGGGAEKSTAPLEPSGSVSRKEDRMAPPAKTEVQKSSTVTYKKAAGILSWGGLGVTLVGAIAALIVGGSTIVGAPLVVILVGCTLMIAGVIADMKADGAGSKTK